MGSRNAAIIRTARTPLLKGNGKGFSFHGGPEAGCGFVSVVHPPPRERGLTQIQISGDIRHGTLKDLRCLVALDCADSLISSRLTSFHMKPATTGGIKYKKFQRDLRHLSVLNH